MLKEIEKTSFLSGERVQTVIQALEKIESDSGLFKKNRRETTAFADGLRTIIIEPYHKRILRKNLLIKTISGKSNFRNNYKPLCKTKSLARSIRIKNNIIGFYPEKGLVCKFLRSSGRRTIANLQNEAVVVKKARELNFFRVPAIVLDHSDTKNQPAIWYEKINGQKYNRSSLAIEFFKKMIPWYHYHGVDLKKPGLLFLVHEEPVTKQHLWSLGWNEQECDLLMEGIEPILNTKKRMPFSWIHGDAGIGNCLLQNNEIVILDWESSRRGFIARDIQKISKNLNGNKIRKMYTEWMSKTLKNNHTVMPVDLQIKIIKLAYGFKLSVKKDYYLNGISHDKAELKLKQKKQALLLIAKNIAGILK